MSIDYYIFGWVEKARILEIENIMIDKWDAFINHSKDFDSDNVATIIVNTDNNMNEFSKNFSIRHFVSRSNNLENNIDYDIQIDIAGEKWLLTPIIIDFDVLHYRSASTSIPMLNRLKEICDLIQPILLMSVTGETISSFYSKDEKSDILRLEPSITAIANVMCGISYFSNEFNIRARLLENTHLYRRISCNSGVLLSSPLGAGYDYERPYVFYDKHNNMYLDEDLNEVLSSIHTTHIENVNRMISFINEKSIF